MAWVLSVVQKMPLVRRKPGHDEEHNADAHVRENDAHPDFFGQRVQETEHAWLLLHGLLDHDADA